jgi:hypothetical protein
MIVFNCNISSYRVRPLIWSYRWILRIFNGTNNKHEKVSQFWLAKSSAIFSNYSAKKWNTVQKNEIQCQKVKHSAKKWNTAPKSETQCIKMKYSAKKWNTVQKNEIQCKKVKYGAKKWNTVQKNEIQCKKMKYSAKKWNTVKKNEIRCKKMKYSACFFPKLHSKPYYYYLYKCLINFGDQLPGIACNNRYYSRNKNGAGHELET